MRRCFAPRIAVTLALASAHGVRWCSSGDNTDKPTTGASKKKSKKGGKGGNSSEKEGGEGGNDTTDATKATPKADASAEPAAPATPAPTPVRDMLPKQLMGELDKFIVGQSDAKRAVAVALRNRWRRHQVEPVEMRDEISPKNILMIGPTGVGKTEIARRMAKVTDAPFLKVEATKYTEVGFKGKDVESIIEDLYAVAKNKARSRLEKGREEEGVKAAHDTVYTAVARLADFAALTQEEYRAKFDAGELDDVLVNVTRTVTAPQPKREGAMGIEIMFGGGEPPAHRETVSRKVPEAFQIAKQEALRKMITDNAVTELAKTLAEEEGIVFVDEIDKVVADANAASADVSALGVQQDLLPLVEGSNVTLKDGTVISTDTILFVCSGAFHVVKPSDMIAELQGRLPVRVELEALTEADFKRILTEPEFNLVRQQVALMKVEGIELSFPDETVDAMAEVAATVNRNAQNIGARRLHTVMERIMDEPSFNCDAHQGEKLVITPDDVHKATAELKKNVELAKFLL
uniref:AAA+ ATPase domain-containing protein n=1 Tax=Neobodo designis TaxID=312471 RepID=A0A7S1L1H6_NEODS|mmetsp:Transcript_11851/g.36873  ORF Transcript_11851/g.36873 Transcript_11851/m.36873 type:complete len:519 (+) Transcript_11851:28-1584(+)